MGILAYTFHLLHSSHHFQTLQTFLKAQCLDVVKAVGKVSARAVPNVTVRFFVTTSRVLLSPLSEDWPVEAVSNVSLASFTRRPEVSSRFSLKMSFGTRSPIPNTPSGKQSHLLMLSML